MKKGFNLISDNVYFFKIFISIFLSLIFIEGVFKFIAFNNVFVVESVRIILFSATLSLILSFIYSFFKPGFSKFLILFTVFVVSAYSTAQLGFNNFMGNYMSLNATGDGATRITDYVGMFIKYIKPEYYVCFLPFIILLVIFIKFKRLLIRQSKSWVNYLFIIIIIILVHSLSLLTLENTNSNQIKSNKELYYKPTLIGLALKEFGTIRFLWRDIVYMVAPSKEETLIVIDEDEKEQVVTDYNRIIDDTEWEAIIANESNETIKKLHNFYINQSITPKNDMTGFYKDKNMIIIMVEAFDMIAIDPEITPTLYKMSQEGWYWNNYYTPKYICTTGDSEYIAQMSIVPQATICVPNRYTKNNYTTSIFNLFNNSGYYSTSYHNYSDKYYERTVLHDSMGSLKFYNNDDLNIEKIYGWPSDLSLMKESIPHFIDQDKFFSFIITSSTHFPYVQDTGIVKRNWDQVKDLPYSTKVKSYMGKAIELDKGLEYLLKSLEEKGKLDNTVIAIFGDHHPLYMDFKDINAKSSIDRLADFNIDRLPFIIYNSQMTPTTYTKTASTFDILPTIANLFDLNYDPRYYVGKDLFSDEETTVIFTNGSWITDKAMYFSTTGTVKKLSEDATDEYIQQVHSRVKNYMTTSDLSLTKDYFKYRFPEKAT